MAENGYENDESVMLKWHRFQETSGRLRPPPRSTAASCVVEGELYIFGGLGGRQPGLGNFWKYSFESDTWEEVQVLSDIKPDARSRTSFAVCPSTLTIYMFGGFVVGARKLNDFWKFDFRSKCWTCIHGNTSDTSPAAQGVNGSIPSKRYAHVSTTYNGKFILFGGYDGVAAMNDLHVFDLPTNTWIEINVEGTWPTARSHAAWTRDSKYLYVHGGHSIHGGLKSDLFALDLETYKWKEILPGGTPPSPRCDHSLCAHGNRLYLHGGYVAPGPPYTPSADLYVYNIESGQWTKGKYNHEDSPCSRGGAAMHIHSNSIYLFGGSDGSNALNDFYRFRLDPISLPSATIGRDMQSLVNNPKFADVRFMVEGKEVNAHKSILVTRSEYFDTMLSSGMREGTSEKPIEISEVSHAIFVKVLEFLYSDEVLLSSLEQAKQLLIASDMFQLERMKILCEHWIRQQLSNETVVSILLLSHRHQATGLKQCAMEYLMRNWSNPVVKQRRNELQNDSDLMLEIIQHKDFTSKKDQS